MRIGVLGGSFDPPHFVHLFIITHLLESRIVDEVILLPTYKHPFKPDQRSFADRFKMLEILTLSLEDTQRLWISNVDKELPENHQGKTYYQLWELQRQHLNDEIVFVMGSDIWSEVHKWYKWEDIKQKWEIIIYGRDEWEDYQYTIPLIFPNISSTDIREKISRGEDVSLFIPNEVLKYIKENGLYNGNN